MGTGEHPVTAMSIAKQVILVKYPNAEGNEKECHIQIEDGDRSEVMYFFFTWLPD